VEGLFPPKPLESAFPDQQRNEGEEKTSFGEASIPNKFVVLLYDEVFSERKFVWSR
jgi:hypothetical protein